MTDGPRPRVSRAARLLGYAGLLPQVAAVASLPFVGPNDPALGHLLALVYGAAILSFLGGVWWGFAVRRTERQAELATLSVLPSLAAASLTIWALATVTLRWPLVTLGAAIIVTLLVDGRLAATGEAPQGWMSLRAPLSLGLGGLTILAGLLA